MPYRESTRRALEARDAGARQDQFLWRIQRRHDALLAFADARALLRELHDVNGRQDVKDAVLLALLSEHRGGGGGEAFALLARALFPAIEHVFFILRRRHKRVEDVEDDDLWGRIVGAFIDTLDRYPIERRPRRVAANILLDTMSVLHREAARDRRLLDERQRATELMREWERVGAPTGFGDLVVPGAERPLPPDGAEFAAAERVLDDDVRAGVIDEADRFLLLGANLYGRRLGELGAALGLQREATKKRHLRALNRIRAARRREQGS